MHIYIYIYNMLYNYIYVYIVDIIRSVGRNGATWKSCRLAPWRDSHGPLLANLLKLLRWRVDVDGAFAEAQWFLLVQRSRVQSEDRRTRVPLPCN